MQFNNFQEAIKAVLEEPIVNAPNNLINRDYFSDTNLFTLETYTEFLDALPKDTYYQIAKELLELILTFQNGETYEIKQIIEKQVIDFFDEKDGWEKIRDKRTPSIKLNSDIRMLEDTKELVSKYFNLGLSDYVTNPMITMHHPEGFKETFYFLTNIIDDLKKKKFEMVDKSNYYGFDIRSKTSLKNYLNEIIKKYNLKSTTVAKKQFIDSIK
jgi:hypothetical protein